MGEYAEYAGRRVKIGTCESMYYLRADQARDVVALSGNVDPVKNADEIRFRFPWPDEDDCAPGSDFHGRDFKRSLPLWGLEVPEGVDHYSVQFVAQAGYNVCLPCPESGEASHGLKVHRNGFGGAVRLIQQKHWEGQLIGVAECGGCGALYRLETPEMLLEAVESLRKTADDRGADGVPSQFYLKVAQRLLDGYRVPA